MAETKDNAKETSISSDSIAGGTKSLTSTVSNPPAPLTSKTRPCRYLVEGKKFIKYLNNLLRQLKKTVAGADIKAQNLKPATKSQPQQQQLQQQQQFSSHQLELINVARRKVAQARKLLHFDDPTSPSENQSENELETLYDDRHSLHELSFNGKLLFCQRLKHYRNSLSPLHFSHKIDLSSKVTLQQIFALLISIEEEHFRANLFERTVKEAVDTLSALMTDIPTDNFSLLKDKVLSELATFSCQLDELQAEDLLTAFNAAFSGFQCNVPVLVSAAKSSSKSPINSAEIADYLVALSALLTATRRLRPTASDALVSLFTSSLDEMVRLTGAQLSMLTRSLLSSSIDTVQSHPLGKHHGDHCQTYRCYIDGALCLLERIFSLQCTPSTGLGAKVGVEALSCLLTSTLPLYVLRMRACRTSFVNLYLPIETFIEERLFLGYLLKKDKLKTTTSSSTSSSVSNLDANLQFSPLTRSLAAHFAENQNLLNFSSVEHKDVVKKLTEFSKPNLKDSSGDTTSEFADKFEKMKKENTAQETLPLLQESISVIVGEAIKEKKVPDDQSKRSLIEINDLPPPVNCIAILAALLRLLVRLTSEPMAVLTDVPMVSPDFKSNTSDPYFELIGFYTRCCETKTKEALKVAKLLLSTFWNRTNKLMLIIEKNEVSVYGNVQSKADLGSKLEAEKTHLKNGPAFTANLEELLLQLHILFETYSDPPNSKHLDKKMVTLGNEVAGKVLNYLAANFGTAIWDYFRLVDEAIEKSISRHIPWGQRGDQFSVMVVYLNSLNLKRPVVSKNEEENVVWWDDVESDDDNDNNDQDVDGISESEDNNDGKRSDDKFVNTSSGKVTVPDGNSSVQNSSSAFVAVNASTVDKRNLSLPQQTASEVALAELSNSMLNMASQMKNTVEAFVKDVTQIKKNLKNEHILAAKSSLSNLVKEVGKEKMSNDANPVDTQETASPEPVTPCCSPSISVAVEEVGLLITTTTNPNGKRFRKDAEKKKQQQNQLNKTAKTSKVQTEILSIDSGNEDAKDKIACQNQGVVICGSKPNAMPTCASASVFTEKKNGSSPPPTTQSSTESQVLLELRELQKRMASYEQTIVQLFNKLDSKMSKESSTSN